LGYIAKGQPVPNIHGPSKLGVSSARLGILALCAGATGIAFAPIFVRISEVGPSATAFYRLLFALPLFWLWAGVEKASGNASSCSKCARDYRDLLFAGLCFAADLSVWHWSIQLTSVANATLLANATPIFVAIGARMLFGERIGLRFIIGMLLALSGVVVLMGANLKVTETYLFGDALALLAAVFYAGYQLSVKRLRSIFRTSTIMSWSGAVTCLALWLVALLSGETLRASTAYGWAILVGLSWTAQVIGQSLIAYAFAHLAASFSSVGLLLQPLIAAVLAWVLLDEPVRPLQGLGGFLALIGIVLARQASR
jgi:Permeases of the drug/metabolite transporter (DMT) superfamily